MIGRPLEKPPPLLLPPSKPRFGSQSDLLTCEEKEKRLEERAVHKFTVKYDAFHGILKRVSDMKLNGSLDSEEPSTESEKSESSAPRHRRIGSGNRTFDDRGTIDSGAFEYESSAGSVTESDNCPPYEEIPRRVDRDRDRGYGCVGLPSPPPPPLSLAPAPLRGDFPSPPLRLRLGRSSEVSSREDLPPRPSPLAFSRDDAGRPPPEFRRNSSSVCRPISLVGPRGGESDSVRPFRFSTSDLNAGDDRRLSAEETIDDAEVIADHEKHQLEMFFRSLKTDVFVCGSLANLYSGWQGNEGNWTFRHAGIVVVVFDCGDARSRNKRRIQILLAERGTCFPLWKDTIDNLSGYRKSGTGFHTMHLSSDHRQILGFSFDSPSEAEKLLSHVEALTSDPENINISVPGSKKKNKDLTKRKSAVLPQKKHISNPCLFQHVTSVAAKDKPIYASLRTLIDDEIVKKPENIS